MKATEQVIEEETAQDVPSLEKLIDWINKSSLPARKEGCNTYHDCSFVPQCLGGDYAIEDLVYVMERSQLKSNPNENWNVKEEVTDWVENRQEKNHVKTLSHFLLFLIEDGINIGDYWIEKIQHPYRKPKNKTINAFILDKVFAKNWVVINQTFFTYDSQYGYWKKVKNDYVKKLIANYLNNTFVVNYDRNLEEHYKNYKFATNEIINSCFNYCVTNLTQIEEIDNDHLIAFKNGTFNIKTGQLETHKSDNYLLHSLPYDYQEKSELPPNFYQFLLDSFGKDQIELIRACISMYLDPTAPYGKFVQITGDSGTGKGTLIEVICNLIGEEFTAADTDFSKLGSKEDRHSDLTGIRLFCVKDSESYLSNLGAFYQLVQNESMSGRARYAQDSYTRKWNIRFILAGVGLPKIENAAKGWKRRCIPIKTLNHNKEDYNLPSKLNQELGDIASWALAIDKEKRNHLLFSSQNWSEKSQEILQESEIASNSVKAFIDQCLCYSEDDQDYIPQTKLYQFYKAYCRATDLKHYNNKNFNDALQQALRDYFRKSTNPTRVKQPNGSYKSVRLPNRYVNVQIANDEIFQFSSSQYSDLFCNLDSLEEGGLTTFSREFSYSDVESVVNVEKSQNSHYEREIDDYKNTTFSTSVNVENIKPQNDYNDYKDFEATTSTKSVNVENKTPSNQDVCHFSTFTTKAKQEVESKSPVQYIFEDF